MAIKAIDYTVILVRDMAAMRRFYSEVLGLPETRALSESWFEYQIGPNTLALSRPWLTADDPPLPVGSAAMQIAFKVDRDDVDLCAATLEAQGVSVLSPPTDRPFGHRTLFFRDPDGNLLEIYAEIPPA